MTSKKDNPYSFERGFEARTFRGTKFDWWVKKVPQAGMLASPRNEALLESLGFRSLRMRLDRAISQPATDEMQIILGLSGEIRLTRHDCGFGNAPHTGRKGTFACIPGHAYFDNEGSGDIEVLILTIPWDTVVREAEVLAADFGGDFGGVHRGSHQDDLVAFLTCRLAAFCSNDVVEAESLTTILIRRLLLLAKPSFKDGVVSGLGASTLKEVLSKIQDARGAKVGLGELASAAALSKYHFIRAFEASTGWTPHQFIMLTQVERARKMIERGRSLAEVAAEAGFADQAHMTRRFNEVLNCSPGYYRSRFFGR